jgi:hypothetical protein
MNFGPLTNMRREFLSQIPAQQKRLYYVFIGLAVAIFISSIALGEYIGGMFFPFWLMVVAFGLLLATIFVPPLYKIYFAEKAIVGVHHAELKTEFKRALDALDDKLMDGNIGTDQAYTVLHVAKQAVLSGVTMEDLDAEFTLRLKLHTFALARARAVFGYNTYKKDNQLFFELCIYYDFTKPRKNHASREERYLIAWSAPL